ncbi:DUF3365 domain-containing protein [Pseudobowmanella zhangzhouensis]|uniref:c-type heme family protein n=1 Tax=Pseudobowmanella zhangzhouensis TaxID=1537679 RepID=UPI003613C47D
MKTVLVGLVAGGLLFCPYAPATNTAQLKADAQAKVQTFAKTLKGELLTAINQGGLVNAIDVCNLKAPAIAAQLSTDGWSVKRTALRVRNPANAPDDWERNVLDYFSATMAKQPATPPSRQRQLTRHRFDICKPSKPGRCVWPVMAAMCPPMCRPH